MEFQSGDLKPFRIPKRCESPKPMEDKKKEMPPLPSVSRRHQIASIDFGNTENAVVSTPTRRKHEERRKRPSTSAAPLDSIMGEMTREMKKQKREQKEITPESKPVVAPVDKSAPPVLTKEYLENRKPELDLVQEFLTRGTLMEYLLGRKMSHGRLEGFTVLGFSRMTDAEIAQMKPPMEYNAPGPSADVVVKSEPPPAIRKGPKTPPGSPGRPQTPPDPPPEPAITEGLKAFAHWAAINGLSSQQMEAFIRAETTKALSKLDQATLIQTFNASKANAEQNKTPIKQEPPPPLRRSDESVKMELVSDCSLSPMIGDDEGDVLAPPPPPPVIEPPPPPPSLPPLPALPPLPPPPIWPNISVMPPTNTSVPPPPIPPSIVPPFPPPILQPPPPILQPPPPIMNIHQPPPPINSSYYPPRFPATTAPLVTPTKASTDISASPAGEVPVVAPEHTRPPPPLAPPPTASWMADLPSWSDETPGDWTREATWSDSRPEAVAPPAPEPPVTVTPSSEKVKNTLLSALGIGGTPTANALPSTPKVAPPPQQNHTPMLDRYGCPLPVPMSHHQRPPMPRPPMPGRGRGGRGGHYMGGPPPHHHMMMTPPAMLRYPHMGNSPMPRGGPPRRRGGTGGRAVKLPQ